jgi:hypothetical protein
MTSNEIAMMHLLIQRLDDCAMAYASYATNFPPEQAAEMVEYAKRLLTSAECFRMDLLEEELRGNLSEARR